jgi:hypothetical protein
MINARVELAYLGLRRLTISCTVMPGVVST